MTTETVAEAGAQPPSQATLRELIRQLRADPDHAPERFVIYAADHLGSGAHDYAERKRREHPEMSTAELGAAVHAETVRITAIDGAISGCPFLIALVPAYTAMLWEQARMALRIAAINGRDTRDPTVAAEILWLRGAHMDLEVARNAVAAVAAGSRHRPAGRGIDRIFAWVALARRVLIFAGFLDPPDPEREAEETRATRRALGLLAVGVLWMVTWILPATFMLLMTYSCVSSTNTLASRTRTYYGGGEHASRTRPPPAPPVSRTRRALRVLALGLSVGVPLAALAISAHYRPAGVHWYYVLIALAGLSLVIALTVSASRR